MDLLACPFCGQNDLSILPDKDEEDGHVYSYHVHCNTCGARGRNNYPIGWCESEEQAKEAWNHRGSVKPLIFYESNDRQKFSIEPHGQDGQYALYVGRDVSHHGLRLCNLYDFDKNRESTISMIVKALNNNKHLED